MSFSWIGKYELVAREADYYSRLANREISVVTYGMLVSMMVVQITTHPKLLSKAKSIDLLNFTRVFICIFHGNIKVRLKKV